MSLSQAICPIFGCFAILVATAGAQPAESSEQQRQAQQALAQAGLTHVKGHWICAEEVQLRYEFEQLPRLDNTFQRQRKKVRQLFRRLESLLTKIEQLQQTVKKNQRRLSGSQVDALERRELQDQNRRHARSISELQKEIRTELDGRREHSRLTQEVIRLTGLQNRLTASVVSIDQLQKQLGERYTALQENKTVGENLKTVGNNHQLGPLEPYATRERRRLNQIAKIVFVTRVPCYVLGDGYRVGAILNDKLPTTFTYQAIDNPTFIPASIAQAANLIIPPDAPRGILKKQLESGESLVGLRKVTIPSLRIGSTVLKDVDAFVMSPEGEDLGARLGPEALKGYSLKIDPRRLTLELRKKGSN